MRRDYCPQRDEWIAHSGDASFLGGAQQWAEDLGKHVGVLVGVKMCDFDAGSLKLAHLCERFSMDFVGVEPSAKRPSRELRNAGDEARAIRIRKQRANAL